MGMISTQSLQEAQGRRPIPRETRKAYETVSFPTFAGFEFQFYLLLLSLWKGKKKKNQDPPLLAVVLS